MIDIFSREINELLCSLSKDTDWYKYNYIRGNSYSDDREILTCLICGKIIEDQPSFLSKSFRKILSDHAMIHIKKYLAFL